MASIREVVPLRKGPGINDARQIDRKVLADYAAYLRDVVRRGDLAVSTAQNRLSSVNRTMAALRGDQCVKLPSPSNALGMQRIGVRLSVPQGQDREQVRKIVDVLCRDHQLRAAAIVLLARATGMRLLEAILANLPRLSREANNLGRMNIQDGTKGGRAGATAPRWISVDNQARGALEFARQVSPAGSRNLIAPSESYLTILQEIVRPARNILHAHSLKGFHELRAAYACDRYEQITRHRAPINGGQCCQVDRSLIARPGGASATSWVTVGSTWSRRTLEDGHEQTIRYGVVLGWRADGLARDTTTPLAAGNAYPR